MDSPVRAGDTEYVHTSYCVYVSDRTICPLRLSPTLFVVSEWDDMREGGLVCVCVCEGVVGGQDVKYCNAGFLILSFPGVFWKRAL